MPAPKNPPAESAPRFSRSFTALAAIIRDTMRRRSLLIGSLVAAVPVAARAKGGPAVPLRVGADVALVDSGLAPALQQAFGRDTGIAVQLVRAPVLPLLDALAAGELDAALTNAPEAEARLEQQGLIHDRRSIASGEFVIVGPAPRARDPAGLAGGRSVAVALGRWRDTATAERGASAFVSANDGSGVHIVEQAAWRRAELAPQAPWYRFAAPGTSLVAQARARGAYAIVERGTWVAEGGAPLAILVEGDPEASESIHAMRSFRSPHPAAKLFIAWIAGAHGRAVVARQRGYRVLAD